MQLLEALFAYERQTLPFDPTVEMCFLSTEEITRKGYNQEYLRLLKLSERSHLYEFMRIGTEVRPYNTLGHIAGVHYVAMYVARQLEALKAPIDLGLVSELRPVTISASTAAGRARKSAHRICTTITRTSASTAPACR